MKQVLIDLEELFYVDCCKRTAHVKHVLEKGEAGLTAKDYDILYQEVDSLYGGARAVHLPELENFLFILASYIRYLKRAGFGMITNGDIKLIHEGICLVQLFGANTSFNLESYEVSLQAFVDRLNARMRKS